MKRGGKINSGIIHVEEPTRVDDPCDLGAHAWAWRVDGVQECPRCGRVRR